MENNNVYFEITATEKVIAKALIEFKIDIFSGLNYEFLNSLNTIYDNGGKRMAISNDSKTIFVCSYYDGIVAYNIETNQVIWRNLKLKSIQNIQVSNDGLLIYIVTESELFYTLESATGVLISKVKGVNDFFKSENENLILIKHDTVYLKSIDEVERQLIKTKNGILNICSSFNQTIIAEIYKSLIMIENSSGNKIWESDLKPGFRINYLKRISEKLISIVAQYSTPSKDENYLLLLDYETGRVLEKTQLSSEYFSFCYSKDGSQLYCSNMDVYDTLSFNKIYLLP
jgi:outer membrane protein assembly factor BamB